MRTAAERWAEQLAGWAVPPEILDAAPRSPWGFDPAVFAAYSDEAIARAEDSPSDAEARAALPAGGSVLDVGAGAGAAGLRLHDAAAEVVAVDQSATLLAAFAERAERLGVPHRSIVGSWPEVAPDTPQADVVVCHHVLYNVPDLVPFVAALDDHARRRVVVELTAVHPLTWMAPLWRALHGIERPDGPRAEDAVTALGDAGFAPSVARWHRPYEAIGESGHSSVERIAQRLCLPEDRLDQLRELLRRSPPPEGRDVVTLSWSPA